MFFSVLTYRTVSGMNRKSADTESEPEKFYCLHVFRHAQELKRACLSFVCGQCLEIAEIGAVRRDLEVVRHPHGKYLYGERGIKRDRHCRLEDMTSDLYRVEPRDDLAAFGPSGEQRAYGAARQEIPLILQQIYL